MISWTFYIVFILYLLECDIRQCSGQTEKTVNLGNNDEPKAYVPPMKNLMVKNDKGARQKLMKHKKKDQTTKKWPRVLRERKPKESTRYTKLDMFQDFVNEEEKTKPLFEDEAVEIDHFSSYSLKQQLIKMSEEIPNVNITIEVIGRTLEYQDILMLRMSENVENKYFRADDHKYAEDIPEKKIIFIVHGLSVMGMTGIPCLSTPDQFRKLLLYYTSHLDKFNIFLIPMANPDGYTFLRSSINQLWDKNVAPQAECPGVALDRNFEVAWSNNNSISSCSQGYPGPTPFSEAETRAVRDIFHKYAHKIVAFFNVHAASYSSSVFRGDAVLYPKGYSDRVVDDDKYVDLKGDIDEAMRNASFQVYSVTVDTLYNWYGPIRGSSVDYASTVYGIPFAMELVMQEYEDDQGINSEEEDYSSLALTEVWGKIIDVIISYIWKSMHGNEVR